MNWTDVDAIPLSRGCCWCFKKFLRTWKCGDFVGVFRRTWPTQWDVAPWCRSMCRSIQRLITWNEEFISRLCIYKLNCRGGIEEPVTKIYKVDEKRLFRKELMWPLWKPICILKNREIEKEKEKEKRGRRTRREWSRWVMPLPDQKTMPISTCRSCLLYTSPSPRD